MPHLSPTRVALIVAAVVVGYFLFSAARDTLLSRQLSQDEQNLRSDVASLTQQRAELQAIRDYLQTDEYIERVARRILGLVRPGETLYIVSSSAPATPGPTPQDGSGDARPWWEKLYGGGGGAP